MGKTYWMLVTTRENFNISSQRGFDIQGFESGQRRKASRIAVDDRIVYYLSDERVFAATATVKSEPFESDEQIWTHSRESEVFPHRVEIEADSVLEDGLCIDAREVGPRLEYVRKWPPEDWPLAFVGQLHIIPQRDFAFLEEEFRRAGTRSQRGGQRGRKSGKGRKSAQRTADSPGDRGPAAAAAG